MLGWKSIRQPHRQQCLPLGLYACQCGTKKRFDLFGHQCSDSQPGRQVFKRAKTFKRSHLLSVTPPLFLSEENACCIKCVTCLKEQSCLSYATCTDMHIDKGVSRKQFFQKCTDLMSYIKKVKRNSCCSPG